ncbi:MAG: hypothetical protein KAX18_10180 [Candidatus Lokiarchaeota archaeon]|nr:hypothetical protein [Candidatus Lokiarchaeota archaeon]
MPKEDFVEKGVNLTLSALEAKERFDAQRAVANDDIVTKINIALTDGLVKAKDFIDGLIWEDNKRRIQNFFESLIL